MNGIEVRLTEVELEKCRQFAKLSAADRKTHNRVVRRYAEKLFNQWVNFK